MNENETIRGIQEWGVDTFGVPDPYRAFTKLVEEVGELSVAIRKQGPDEVAEEIADVIVTAIHCGSSGQVRDIQTAVNRKMARNRARTWTLRGDGTADHLEEGGATRSSDVPPVLRSDEESTLP